MNLEKLKARVAEAWKPVVGHETTYEVSSFGRVRSRRGILKQRLDRRGYPVVTLCWGRRRHMSVHRLVAEAFIPNPENKRTVNHKDSIKTNNIPDNLEWNTYSENLKHSYQHGGRTSNLPEPTRRAVIGVDKDGNGMYLRSCFEAHKFGWQNSNINRCALGGRRHKTAYGYTWEFFK